MENGKLPQARGEAVQNGHHDHEARAFLPINRSQRGEPALPERMDVKEISAQHDKADRAGADEVDSFSQDQPSGQDEEDGGQRKKGKGQRERGELDRLDIQNNRNQFDGNEGEDRRPKRSVQRRDGDK